MLSRAGSKTSSNNLRRSKSTTSVSERRKHPLIPTLPSPQTSRLHALIAAHRAMDRSHEVSIESVSQLNSNIDHHDTSQRRPSIRLSPALATQKQLSNTYTKASQPPVFPQPARYDRESDYSCDTSITGTDPGRASSRADLPLHRHVRGTKSMLMAGREHGGSTGSETALSQAQTLRNAASCVNLYESSLRVRLRRSLKLLRPTSRMTKGPAFVQSEIDCRPESIVLARSQFLQEAGQPETRGNVSKLHQPKTKRRQKAFRTTLRTAVSHDNTAEIELLSEPSLSLVRKTRSISTSLRSRFVKTFTKRRLDAVTIPPQQITATRDHLSISSVNTDVETGFDSYHDTDVSSAKRSSIYVPSAQHPETCDDVDKLSERLLASTSLESLQSTSKSRVTSWTNSTATASVRGTPYEKNRLSIIKEDGGPHQPSSSVGRHIGGVSAFQQPMKLQGSSPVDSQRIYSALRKRIDQEQDEMLATQVALDNIHEAEEQANGRYCRTKGYHNIRLVPSQSSLALTDEIDHTDQSSQNFTILEESEALPDEESEQDQVVEPRKRSFRRDVPSSFFPFSSESKSRSASPFKKLLIAKRQRQDDNSSCDDLISCESAPIRNPRVSDINTRKFGRSSDSIYSRTTDGGLNLQYAPQIGSMESFQPNSVHGSQDTGTATILYSNYGIPNGIHDPAARVPTGISATASEKGAWRGWVESQMASLARHGSKTSVHVRERAVIVPEEPETAKTDTSWCTRGQIDRNRHISSSISEGDIEHAQPQDVLSNIISSRSNSNMIGYETKSLGYASMSSIIDQRQHEAGSEAFKSGTLRKVSPGSVMRMLKKKRSEILPSPQSELGKENRSSMDTSSIPFSTPGRLHLQTMSGNGTRRLRSRKCETDIRNSEFRNLSAKDQSPEATQESPGDRFKATLSARLSRPFDMDVPQSNRPFDSMYLGKRESGHAEPMRGDRLSVAAITQHLRPFKSYGALGLTSVNIGEGTTENRAHAEDTALPPMPVERDNENRSASLSGFAVSSKRMVSQFLRSRRKPSELDENTNFASSSSHAFI